MKLIRLLSVLLVVSAFVGCGEKSDMEKAKDDMKDAGQEISNAADHVKDAATKKVDEHK